MSDEPANVPDEKRKPALPFRMQICDLLGVAVLTAVHMALLNKITRVHEDDVERIIAFFALGLIFPAGAAYLACRLGTEQRMLSPWERLTLLVGLDIALVIGFGGLVFLIAAAGRAFAKALPIVVVVLCVFWIFRKVGSKR